MSRYVQRLGLVALVIFGIPGSTSGEPVSIQDAKRVAVNQLLSTGWVVRDAAPAIEVIPETEGERDIYYTINFQPEGWAIVSADDVAYPVIAYSASGRQVDEGVSPSFAAWMENVKAEIVDAIDQKMWPLPEASEAWARLAVDTEDFLIQLEGQERGSTAGPLIQSSWNQGETIEVWLFGWNHNDYNELCPWEYTDGTHLIRCYAPTGCVATAMAQIMRYWGWPNCARGNIPGYDPPHQCSHACSSLYDWMEVGCGGNCFYDWQAMSLGGHTDETARLMMNIGVAVEMDYECGGSGAYSSDGIYAYENYFHYSTALHIRFRSSHPTTWAADLRAEIDAGRPVQYAGFGSGGHAFICDGYEIDSPNHFHFNWGWGGSHNGHYYLDDLTPGSYDFTEDQQAFFNLHPDYPGQIWVDGGYTPQSCAGHDWGYNAFDNLQEAIDWARGPTTIHVGPGAYGPVKVLAKNDVTLVGEGADTVVVTGLGVGDDGLPINLPAIFATAVSNLQIENLTIQVVSLVPSNPSFGLQCLVGDVTLTGCEIRRVVTIPAETTGLHINSANVTLIDCSFTQAGPPMQVPGAGVFNANGQIHAENCSFVGLRSSGDGAAVRSVMGMGSELVNCLFAGNSAQRGGAIADLVSATPLQLQNCLFTGNSAATYGGAVYAEGAGGWPAFSNCTLSGNAAGEMGGGHLCPRLQRADDGELHRVGQHGPHGRADSRARNGHP